METETTVKFLTKLDGEYKTVELQSSNISEFGVNCRAIYRRGDGGFKKWVKRGYVISEGVHYICGYDLIADLKKDFKGRIASVVKHTQSENKYSTRGSFRGERKATDWKYELKTPNQ